MTDSNKTYTVNVNEFEFSFTAEDAAAVDLIKNADSSYHLIKDKQSVKASVISTDLNSKQVVTEVDGEIFEVHIIDELATMIESMGFNSVSKKQIKEIKAPMPGLVLEITATEGQELEEGEKVLILEAMKMENSILMHMNARIKKILVKTGQAVEKGQVLAELE